MTEPIFIEPDKTPFLYPAGGLGHTPDGIDTPAVPPEDPVIAASDVAPIPQPEEEP